jgi:hypothetical protein
MFDEEITAPQIVLPQGVKMDSLKFEKSLPKILQDGYKYPVCDKLLEDTYILYKKAFHVNRRRRF